MLVGPVCVFKSVVREPALALRTNLAQKHLSNLVQIPPASMKAEFGHMTEG